MTNVQRRTVLKVAGASAGATVLIGTFGEHVAAASTFFQHGVASGDPLPESVLLWTRVTPTPDSLPGSGAGPNVDLSWQVASDSAFTSIVREGTIATGTGSDHTAKVVATGLTASTTYWYRFAYAGQWSTVGRTITAPAANAALSRLRIGVVSCSHWEAGYFAAYRHLAARGDLSLVIHLGDYLYEYGTGSGGVRVVAPAHETLSLADYRIRHAHYKTDPDLQALHASVPWAITWDDHEVANDMWSGGAENHDPATEGSFAARVAAARQAYYEWMPVRTGANGAIYRKLRFGSLFELSMLDLRTYRSQQTSGSGIDDPARTIAGDDQMAWLKSSLVGSTAKWKLVGNSVMISRLDIGALPSWLLGPLRELLGIPQNGLAINTDQWDGYNADRNELVNHLRANGTRNVVFLTGDIHTSWANELTTQATGADNPAAAEFVVPSVTSDNINDFLGLSPGNLLSLTGAGLIRATNPHVKWTELDGHGYCVLEVTPTRCRMDWYHLADRRRRDTGTRWITGFSVSAGSSRLTREWTPLS